MILVIDNNDSFTYNLIDYIKTQTKITVVIVAIKRTTYILFSDSNRFTNR